MEEEGFGMEMGAEAAVAKRAAVLETGGAGVEGAVVNVLETLKVGAEATTMVGNTVVGKSAVDVRAKVTLGRELTLELGAGARTSLGPWLGASPA